MPVIPAAILNFWHVDICMPARPQTITQSVPKVHWAPAEIQFLLPTDICRRLAGAAAETRATFANCHQFRWSGWQLIEGPCKHRRSSSAPAQNHIHKLPVGLGHTCGQLLNIAAGGRRSRPAALCVVDGRWSMVARRWSVVNGRWSAVSISCHRQQEQEQEQQDNGSWCAICLKCAFDKRLLTSWSAAVGFQNKSLWLHLKLTHVDDD